MTKILAICAAVSLASVDGMRTSQSQRAPTPFSDPAVEAYTSFVDGRQLKGPADQKAIIAGLDRLASAVEELALREIGPGAPVLAAARQVRYQIRQLQPFAPDTPSRLRNRWKVFVAAGRLIDDLSNGLGPLGATEALREAVLRAADSIDYDDPPRWQPEALEQFFALSARALKQMADGGPERIRN
jgi:hypothetical protein